MARWLRQHLFGHVLPFWETQFDEANGGIFTCLENDGTRVSHDKWLWSQWRAVWVCARIFNTLEADPKWLQRAEAIATFCCAHGWVPEEKGWALLLGETGELKRGCDSIYADAFAVYGMTELAAASGDTRWLTRARETADSTINRIDSLGDALPHFPYPIVPGTKPQGIPMIWSLKMAGLGNATGDAKYLDRARAALAEIDHDFYDIAEDRLLESVSRSGGARPPLVGEVTVPGHVIEGLWFRRLIEASDETDSERFTETWRRMLRHFELGWDREQGGGFLLAIDSNGPAPEGGWPFGDTKLWWPHTEAQFASLLGWHETENPVWVDWYERLWEFAFDHFVDWENGEWYQKLNRDLTPFTGTIALPVKDPFHLPRSLILQIELLERNAPPSV